MSSAGLLLLLLLPLLFSASCLAQDQPTIANTCSVQSTTITCTCGPGLEKLELTPPFMQGAGGADELKISGCSSVTFAFPPLQRLRALSVSNTAAATFQEKAWPQLRHLSLMNVSQVALDGAIFQGAALETLWLEDIHVKTVPSGAFANLSTIQNVTFTDVHFDEVQEGAVGFEMVLNSQLIIMNSELLGVHKSGIVVKGVAHFTMHQSNLTTVGEGGLQLYAIGPVSITNSHLQLGGSLNLSVPSGTTFTFNNNVWRGLDVFQVAQQLQLSGAIFQASRNTFDCVCGPKTENLVNSPGAKLLLNDNQCEGLCRVPVSMSLLTSCGNKTALEAGCNNPPVDSVTARGSAPPGVTQAPRTAKPLSPGKKNTATSTTTISVTAAILLTVPAAVALAL